MILTFASLRGINSSLYDWIFVRGYLSVLYCKCSLSSLYNLKGLSMKIQIMGD